MPNGSPNRLLTHGQLYSAKACATLSVRNGSSEQDRSLSGEALTRTHQMLCVVQQVSGTKSWPGTAQVGLALHNLHSCSRAAYLLSKKERALERFRAVVPFYPQAITAKNDSAYLAIKKAVSDIVEYETLTCHLKADMCTPVCCWKA